MVLLWVGVGSAAIVLLLMRTFGATKLAAARRLVVSSGSGIASTIIKDVPSLSTTTHRRQHSPRAGLRRHELDVDAYNQRTHHHAFLKYDRTRHPILYLLDHLLVPAANTYTYHTTFREDTSSLC